MKENKKSEKRERLLIDELTANAEKVSKDKELNSNGKKLFEKTLNKAVIQHSPK